ncbi:MAG: DNA-binding response regulator [Thiotrichales bacterium]|nr:MAG: DNA-binding response regulator [Thiotrichales bacterium]
MNKILIVDDHAIVRAGLKQILNEGMLDVTVDEVDCGMGAIERLKHDQYDVILLDISLPDKSGIDVLKRIRADENKTPVLILSIHASDQYALRAFRCGANGYINKEAVTDELLKAVKKVSSGGRYISENTADMLLDILEGDSSEAPHSRLSDREYEVLRLIASGESLTQIGERLSLSVKTISTYRTRILAKMKMKDNNELTHYAIKMDLL